jgi:uncharacterized membrane protein YsdA (DUF1294 family)/cold shock CspA family protein
MRYQGKIVEWNAEKAFGFVLPNAGGRKIFVHLNEFPNRRAPQVGALITFEIGVDANRRSCAVRASFVASPEARRAREQTREEAVARASWGAVSVWLGALWTVAVVGLTISGAYPWKLLVAWFAVNGMTFALYAADKRAAEQDRRRTSEARLHVYALAGGWPAAALAQQWLRHKTSKISFRTTFWFSVLANVGFMLWLASRHGATFVEVFR